MAQLKDTLHSLPSFKVWNVFKSFSKHTIICISAAANPFPICWHFSCLLMSVFPRVWNYPPTFLYSQYKPPWFGSHHSCWSVQLWRRPLTLYNGSLDHNLYLSSSTQLSSLLTHLPAGVFPLFQTILLILASSFILHTWSWYTHSFYMPDHDIVSSIEYFGD